MLSYLDSLAADVTYQLFNPVLPGASPASASVATDCRRETYLSRLQSFTEPSAAQEARLTSFWSKDTVDLGWNTIAPTFVLWPKGV